MLPTSDVATAEQHADIGPTTVSTPDAATAVDLATLAPVGFFSRLYAQVLRWASHRHAGRYLAGVTFAESSVFPIPPEAMLIPMTLVRPERALRYAGIATVASVVGGLYGYALGHYGAAFVEPAIVRLGYGPAFETVLVWFDRWGFWAVLGAGFTPVPYKLFTLGAGLLGLGLIPFALASLIGRGTRFMLVCLLIAKAGPRFAPLVEIWIERIGWTLVAVLGIAALWTFFGSGA